jgi:AcrR family transcriptional regulator
MARAKSNAWNAAKREETNARRELILRAATRRLNASGYARTSMAAIAADLGLTTNALYHYFRAKADILYGCFERALTLITRCVDAGSTAEGSGLSRLLVYSRAMRELIESEPLPGAWHAVHLKRKQLTVVAERDAANRRRLSEILRDGIADGSIRSCDAEVAIAILTSGIQTFPYPGLAGKPNEAVYVELEHLLERALAS